MHRFIMLLFVAGAGCSSPIRKDAPLIGRWSTGCAMSQLGPSMTRYTFRSDQTFTGSFTTCWFLRLGGSGTYAVEGDRLRLQTTDRTNTARFYFDGDHLVIHEGSDTFRLRKLGDAK